MTWVLGDAGADPCLAGVRGQIGNATQVLWRVDIDEGVVAIHKGHSIGTGVPEPQLDDVSMNGISPHVLACNPFFADHAIAERLQPPDDLLRR
ncbi:MAG TPA: hypothetical protein VNO19_08630 [Gemmatimonadales bacterium]|nr:hypothetical protein [Gemmatimonadales bacterium]